MTYNGSVYISVKIQLTKTVCNITVHKSAKHLLCKKKTTVTMLQYCDKVYSVGTQTCSIG